MSSYTTKHGQFDGTSWEELCQQIFKMKFGLDGYQEMPASPGDYGIEGFVKQFGIAYQCYCPNKHYTQTELYEKQRDKITKDLGKLNTYKDELKDRLGDLKIKKWIFLCPEINKNELLAHAISKQTDIRNLKLEILDDEFEVELQDADFYIKEMHQIKNFNGFKIAFQDEAPFMELFDESTEEYTDNIKRKNKKRCIVDGEVNQHRHAKLNALTLKKWFEGDNLLRKIEREFADVYYQLAKVINQYESELEESCLTWADLPEKLIEDVRNNLRQRIKESIPSIDDAERCKIADSMTSKWIALCPLEID